MKEETAKLPTPAEAAQALRVKVQTLANWRAKRKGPPYVKVGGAIRYLPLDAYIKANTISPEG